MAPERPRDESAPPEPAAKKTKRAFRAGPDNLPDGPWRRKILKTKQELIHSAKIKKSYARLRARELASHTSIPNHERDKSRTPAGPEMHPDRQRVLGQAETNDRSDTVPPEPKTRRERQSSNETKAATGAERSSHELRRQEPYHEGGENHLQARPRPVIFARAARGAARKEAQLEAAARKERLRQDALAQRDRRRKAISKSQGRGGAKMGKQKLGRQGNVLLDKIKKMVGES